MVKELDTSSLHSIKYEDEDWNSQFECSKSIVSQNGSVILQKNDQNESSPTFGNISVTNGTDIHFGNKTFYQGPVTIQQFLYANGEEKLENVTESDISPSAIKKFNSSDIRNFKKGMDNPLCEEASVIETSDINVSANVTTLGKKADEVEYVNGHRLKSFIFKYRIAAVSASVFILVISLLPLMLILIMRTNAVPIVETDNKNNSTDLPRIVDDEHDHNTPIKAPTDPVTSLKPSKLKIVTRLEWLAQPPSKPVTPLKTPVPYVIISHTATENCSSQAQCVFQVRQIQTYHLESRGWYDIGYNFLVGGDGEVYTGRGWTAEGSHTYGYNYLSTGIAFIGTFISSKPPEYQLDACKKLIARGVELGYIQKNYKLLGMRQLQTTQSPGDMLYKEIQTWPHWSKFS